MVLPDTQNDEIVAVAVPPTTEAGTQAGEVYSSAPISGILLERVVKSISFVTSLTTTPKLSIDGLLDGTRCKSVGETYTGFTLTEAASLPVVCQLARVA